MQAIKESEKAGMLRSSALPCEDAMRTMTAALRQTGAGSSSLAQSSLITSSMQSYEHWTEFEKNKNARAKILCQNYAPVG
jgi:hypothetical protein